MTLLLTILTGVLCIGGAIFVLLSAIAMLRSRDGLSRINVLSSATGMGLPWIATGVYIQHVVVHGFDVITLIKLLVAIAGFIIMSSVASNALGRAAYRSGAPLDPATDPNELA
ncbi:monovalent cation/H(+) antiporter subunit G [uncultured Serinicoccus sp.]|uniref:cation:proton antiporter n=1 Tax=uncultured Serinicoccus sp. TaxID=735514 RepID=UPI00263A3AFB|nr:monovalent cation/H(+) antiporter subunit G [uncultured Serinicoccus sp.]